MKKIFFLVNKKDDFTSEKHLEKHLKNFEIRIEETLPQNIDNYDLIILETSGIGQSDTEILEHSEQSRNKNFELF